MTLKSIEGIDVDGKPTFSRSNSGHKLLHSNSDYNHAGAVHADQGLTTPLHADKNQAPSPFSPGTNLYMTKILFSILFCTAAFMANGCVSVQMQPSTGMGPDVYRISALATSKKIIGETVTIAKERCAQTNKQYLFVKNIFQHSSNLGINMVSYELYFTCVEAGDPRLNELKSLLSPAEKNEDQAGQTSPTKEPVQEKPSVSSGKDAAPAPDKLSPPKDENQGQQEKPVKVTEEQVREENPRIAVPESMQTDDSPIIEEDLGGHPIDKENYLKRRFRKKKQTK